MRTAQISLPEIGLIAGTRALLGAGLGLLLADRLSDSQRRAVGLTLLLVGLATTVPLGLEIRSHLVSSSEPKSAKKNAEAAARLAEMHA